MSPFMSWDAVFLLLSYFYILLCPYTKVEESFSLQATHDLLVYGPINITPYDHHLYSGVVPRTFIPPIVLSTLAYPLTVIIPDKRLWQYLVRGILATSITLSLRHVRLSARKVFGDGTAWWMGAFNVIQFHLAFWGSRTLPNIFALVIWNVGVGYWLLDHFNSKAVYSKKHDYHVDSAYRVLHRNQRLYIWCFAFAALTLRCELILLSGIIALSEMFVYKELPFVTALPVASLALIVSVASTVAVDGWFWRYKYWWPELQVFWFNAIENKVLCCSSLYPVHKFSLIPSLSLAYGVPYPITLILPAYYLVSPRLLSLYPFPPFSSAQLPAAT